MRTISKRFGLGEAEKLSQSWLCDDDYCHYCGDHHYCRDYHGDNLDNRGDCYANYDSCGGEDGDSYVGECAPNL